MNAPRTGLLQRLGRAFLLHAGVISVVAVMSVFVAGFTLQQILIQQALREEAEFFWERYRQDPEFPLPATQNLTGYFSDRPLPEYLRDYGPGFHHLTAPAIGNAKVLVSDRDGRRLYLLFDHERVSELAVYFGLLPLAGILVVLYLGAWLAYRMSRRAVSPFIWLAEEVNRLDPQAPDGSSFAPERLPVDGHSELWVLATAIKNFAERLNAFVERERNFTRDASHELRSPLTVMKMAAELLAEEPQLSDRGRQLTDRVRRCAREMEDLVEMFLLLARESDQQLTTRQVCINDVVAAELQRAGLLAGAKHDSIRAETVADGRLLVNAPEQVLSVLIGNLVRNAYSYTDAGTVTVRIARQMLSIEDSGVGLDARQVEQVFRPYFRADQRQRGGHGVGLTIVKRLSDRFRWPVEIDSRPGVGTRVSVSFPQSSLEPLEHVCKPRQPS